MGTKQARRGAVAGRPPAVVGQRWEAGAQEVFLGLREWRALHPTATLADLEAELDRRWLRLRADMLADLALASAATDVQAGERPACPHCGGPVRDGGTQDRTLVTLGNAAVTLRRDYVTCAACGRGSFPPGR
jgi:hypothetical protein